ncbi:MAG TPA: hypothetical protein VFP46_01720 [Candidatus Paceibacterota bacterium]|nr:hypothetical protein [Candidatus Paceibacterota bacterium]
MEARNAMYKREPVRTIQIIVRSGKGSLRFELVVVGCYEQVSFGRGNGCMYCSACLPADFARFPELSDREKADLCFELVDYRPKYQSGTLKIPPRYASVVESEELAPGITRL